MALNANKIKAPQGNKQGLVPQGMHRARVVQVIDLGVQHRKPFKGKAKSDVNQLWVTYELTDLFMKDGDGNDEKDQPRWISERMNLFSLDQDNATSTKRINGIDPEGVLNGDWAQVVDLPCLVQVVHSKDKKYANIGSVNPPMVGGETPPLAHPEKGKVFDLGEPDMEVYNALPNFLQEIIQENVDFEGSALQKAIEGAAPEGEEEEVVEEAGEEEEIY